MDDIDKMLEDLEGLFEDREDGADFTDEPIPDFCTQLSCMGTPKEILALIHSGYGAALQQINVTIMACDRNGEIVTKRISMVQLQCKSNGCAMHVNGECLLWKSRLTPAMGELHLLKGRKFGTKSRKFLFNIVTLEWLNPANTSVVGLCLRGLEMIDKNPDS